MDPVTIADLAVRGASGLANGIYMASTSYDRWNTQRNELTSQLEATQEQIQYITDSYNNNMAQLNASLETSLSQNSSAYRSAFTARSNSANVASYSNVEAQESMYGELAQIQQQGYAAIGTAAQSVASTGFRLTEGGTTGNTVEEAVTAATEAYDQALSKLRASAYQSYMQASAAYSDSSLRMESYRESMRVAKESYRLQSEALTTEKDYNLSTAQRQEEYIQGQIDALGEWNGWWAVGDFFKGLFGIS